MRHAWFKPLGWLFRPVSWQGWLAMAAWLGFVAQVVVAVDRHSHSASDTLFGVFPYLVPAFLLLDWLASRTGAARRA